MTLELVRRVKTAVEAASNKRRKCKLAMDTVAFIGGSWSYGANEVNGSIVGHGIFTIP